MFHSLICFLRVENCVFQFLVCMPSTNVISDIIGVLALFGDTIYCVSLYVKKRELNRASCNTNLY